MIRRVLAATGFATALAAVVGCGGAPTPPPAERPEAAVDHRRAEEPPAEVVAHAALMKEFCERTACRPNTHVVMPDGEGGGVDLWVVRSPYAENDVIELFSGETASFEADVVDGRLANFRFMPVIVDPSRTITFSLGSMDGDGSQPGTWLLVIKSGFPETLKYEAGYWPAVAKPGLYKTSVCPLHSGVSSMEMWPQPVVQIKMRNFRIAGPNETMCE